MWRSNVSWNSTDSSLPEGMHKHETGAYFRTAAGEPAQSCRSGSPSALEEEPSEDVASSEPHAPPSQAKNRQQAAGSDRSRRKLRESQRNSSNSSASIAATGRPVSSSVAQPANFRARLSSISDALHHPPRLAKRLFTGAHQQQHNQAHQQHHEESLAPVQITTTSIDSPQHQAGDGHGPQEHARPMLSSGRRLSQLFLPQLGAHAPNDPFGQAPELFPAHLLGLYGQPPLVGGGSQALGAGGPRASWADISLLGRLANVRPSIDSAFHGPSAGQMRHSFDARK